MGERGENWKVDPYSILFISHTPSADTALGWGTSFPCCSVAEDSLKLHSFPFQNTDHIYKPPALTDQMETVWKSELVLRAANRLHNSITLQWLQLWPSVCSQTHSPLSPTQNKHRGFSAKFFSCISSIFWGYQNSCVPFSLSPRATLAVTGEKQTIKWDLPDLF